jgi:hypothetical protein
MAPRLSDEAEKSNLRPEDIKGALADYVELRGVLDRANMSLARNQAKHEKLGVDAKLIRTMYAEGKLTAQERAGKWAQQLRYRLAIFSEDPGGQMRMDFDAPAEPTGMSVEEYEADQRIRCARAYNDAYNSYLHGGRTVMNPHIAGSEEFAKFAQGLKDAEADGVEPVQRGRPKKDAAAVSTAPKPTSQPKPAELPAEAAPAKRRGRPSNAEKAARVSAARLN